MPSYRLLVAGVPCLVALLSAGNVHAQPLGTFRWQLQPFCNAVVVSITQQGANYLVDGFDDQCGAAQRAPLVGLATPNPDGTIGFGLTIVTAPGGRGVHVDARISLPALSGTWTDSTGNTGTFAFGAAAGGSPRPPVSIIPPSITFATDGGFVARANGPGVIPASGPGTRMMWHSGKGAFRAGAALGAEWDDVSIGLRSVAFGTGATASGRNSFAGGDASRATGTNSVAFGFDATASGLSSTALGTSTTASGSESVAMGGLTVASGAAAVALGSQSQAAGPMSFAVGFFASATGARSVAMGERTIATGVGSIAVGLATSAAGNASVALGQETSASGDASVALGNRAVATAAADGSFVFADRSSGNTFTSFTANQFLARAAGGVGFYTNAATTTGVELAPNGSSWAPLSDANAKENFRDVDGEDVLAKLAAMSIQEWNYKAQDTSIRHMGPTAQEFRAAFGLGDFPLRINTIDADGVALAAVKALEARTRALPRADDVARLEAENADLRARLERLEALLRAK